MSWENDLNEWAKKERTAKPPTPTESAALIARAQGPQFNWLKLAIPSAAALIITALFWPSPQQPPTLIAQAPAIEEARDELIQEKLKVGTTERKGDRFTLTADSVAEVAEKGPTTRVKLTKGLIEVTAAKRSAGQSLIIATGDFRVQVVGTQFTVQAYPFEVNVTEGLVKVADLTGGEWMLSAGEQFSNGKHIREKHIREKHIREKELPDVAFIRTQVLNGEYEAARSGLNERLQASEQELSSWTLLAQLESRAGHMEEGIAAWDAVIKFGSVNDSQRGRYEAARLLEEQPSRAIPYLEAFLSTPDPLEAEARLRLAKALHSLGKIGEARLQLEQITSAHPGTGAAKKAKKMLADLKK